MDRSDGLNSSGYLGFGGGGFGTSVVSYAPLPMSGCGASLVIILNVKSAAEPSCQLSRSSYTFGRAKTQSDSWGYGRCLPLSRGLHVGLLDS